MRFDLFPWRTVQVTDDWRYQEHRGTGLRRAVARRRDFCAFPDFEWLMRGTVFRPALTSVVRLIYWGCEPCKPRERISGGRP